jgi:hypothetical protein
LSRRTSPNSPKDKSGSRCISDAPSNQGVRKRIIQNNAAQSYHDAPSQSVAPKKCRYPSAKAGTHTPCRLVSAMWQIPFSKRQARGYGSPPSRGRPR